MDDKELKATVQLLADVEAIKKLQAQFCFANDDDDWKGTAELFAEDGVADFGSFGYCEGKAEIAKLFKDLPTGMPFRFHTLHLPVINVNGNNATGRFYFQTSATNSDNRAISIAGECLSDYIKVNGEWKFKKCAAKFHYVTPYEDGWVKTKFFGED